MRIVDPLPLKGKLEIFVTKGTPKIKKGVDHIDFSGVEIIDTIVENNIILAAGKNKTLHSLVTGFNKAICRMAIGDRGALPSDPTVPKVPNQKMTALYNEIYRSDLDDIIETLSEDVHQIKFIKSFSALNVPTASFSNQAKPVVNEIGLVMCDLLSGTPLPRPDIAFPDKPLADEELFSIRCYKSVPFEAANEIAITIRYTVFIE